MSSPPPSNLIPLSQHLNSELGSNDRPLSVISPLRFLPTRLKSRSTLLFDHPNLKLGPNNIRLLRPLSTDGQLEFELLAVPRSQAPRYTAISYTWGDELAKNSIHLNGARFPVRWNLWSCLHHLAVQAARSDLPWDYIWVDSMCVNQADNSELEQGRKQ